MAPALLGRRRPVRGHSDRPVPGGSGWRRAGCGRLGEGSVWVANSGDGTVSEVSPAAGTTVGEPIYVGNGPSGIAVGLGAVWIALSVDGAVAKIDPDTGRVALHFFGGANPAR